MVGRSPSRRDLLALLAGSVICACTPDEQPEPPEVPDIEYCDAVRDWEPAWSAYEDEVVRLLNERRAVGGKCADQTFDPSGMIRRSTATTPS